VETTLGRHRALAVLIGLARQPDNVVTLSYRRDKLVRIGKKNEDRIAPLLRSGVVRPMFGSRVTEIRPDAVTLAVGAETMELPNDYVFVFAGGEPPYAFLRSAGVSFGEGGAAPAPSSSPGTSRAPGPRVPDGAGGVVLLQVGPVDRVLQALAPRGYRPNGDLSLGNLDEVGGGVRTWTGE
jgi:hypothetical protein